VPVNKGSARAVDAGMDDDDGITFIPSHCPHHRSCACQFCHSRLRGLFDIPCRQVVNRTLGDSQRLAGWGLAEARRLSQPVPIAKADRRAGVFGAFDVGNRDHFAFLRFRGAAIEPKDCAQLAHNCRVRARDSISVWLGAPAGRYSLAVEEVLQSIGKAVQRAEVDAAL
jgi:hypothetical protein